MRFRLVMSSARRPYRFEIEASENETLARSESYASKDAALRDIERIKADAGGATVVDET